MTLPNTSDSTSASSFQVNPNSVAPTSNSPGKSFIDRRTFGDSRSGRPERRQFGSSHAGLSPEGRELALAIDEYKVQRHRRYLTCDEMLQVLAELGYSKNS